MNYQYRLQPIVDLQDHKNIAHELLAGEHSCPDWDTVQWQQWYCWLKDRIPEILSGVSGLVFVNLSSDQLADPKIYACLQHWTDYVDRVLLEWTEAHPTAATLDATTDKIRSLQDLGFQFAIDDIGSPLGIDGLWRASSIRPSFCKIDGPYFQSNKRSPSLCHLFEYLSSSEASIIVEWIETEEDLQLAREYGAGFGQGYLFH